MKAHNFRMAQNNLTVLYALLMPEEGICGCFSVFIEAFRKDVRISCFATEPHRCEQTQVHKGKKVK